VVLNLFFAVKGLAVLCLSYLSLLSRFGLTSLGVEAAEVPLEGFADLIEAVPVEADLVALPDSEEAGFVLLGVPNALACPIDGVDEAFAPVSCKVRVPRVFILFQCKFSLVVFGCGRY